MGLFEQYPWLLIPIIILTVEGWTAVKAFAMQAIRRHSRYNTADATKQ